MNFGLFGRGSDGWLLVFGLGRQSGGAMGMSNPLAGMSGMGATMPTGMPPAMQAMGVPGMCFCTCVWLFVLFVLCWTSKAYSSLLSSCFFFMLPNRLKLNNWEFLSLSLSLVTDTCRFESIKLVGISLGDRI